MARRRGGETYLVTTAARSPDDDRRQREKRYLILMGLRVIAIIGAIIVGTVLHSPVLLGILVVAALVLPWLAVVIANSGPAPQARESPSLWTPQRRRIDDGSHPKDTA